MMRNLIGQSFPLADRVYRIVDVRQVAGDAMIYAEPVAFATEGAEPVAFATEGSGSVADASGASQGWSGAPPLAAGPARAARAAFHYRDIAAHLPALRRG
jgi:hypothetical protein